MARGLKVAEYDGGDTRSRYVSGRWQTSKLLGVYGKGLHTNVITCLYLFDYGGYTTGLFVPGTPWGSRALPSWRASRLSGEAPTAITPFVQRRSFACDFSVVYLRGFLCGTPARATWEGNTAKKTNQRKVTVWEVSEQILASRLSWSLAP